MIFFTMLSERFNLQFCRRCDEINRQHFFGQPIVSSSENGISINYSRLELMNQPYMSPIVVVPTISVVSVDALNKQPYSSSPLHPPPPYQGGIAVATAVSGPTVVVASAAPSSRQMQVIVPHGATSGTTIAVQSPQGDNLSVFY
jgi:hypothetical protein